MHANISVSTLINVFFFQLSTFLYGIFIIKNLKLFNINLYHAKI